MRHVLRFTMFIAAMAGPAALALAQAAIHEETPVTVQEEQPNLVANRGGDIQWHVDAILHAPDPSSAVAAYVAAKSVLPDSSRIDQAYVRRMVEFGLPQMADTQAHALVQHDPKDGLAWGVIAFTLATRGQTTDALRDIATATRYLPDDPFIQRTAGQLLAWYDTVADKSALPDSVKTSVQAVRNQMAAQRAYVDAYQAARSAYEQGTNPAEAGPASAEANPEYPAPGVYGGGYAYGNDYGAGYAYGNDYGAEPYTFGTVPYGYAYPTYLYPGYADYFPYWGGFYGGFWWPGAFSSVLVPTDDFFFRNRFFHHEPDLDDFIGFPGHRFFGDRFFGHRFFDRDDFFRHRFDRDIFFGRRAFNSRPFGSFDWQRRGFATRSPQITRAPRFAPMPRTTTGMPRSFAPAPHMSRGPQFTFAPHTASPRFAAGPHFSGGGHMAGGGGGGHRR